MSEGLSNIWHTQFFFRKSIVRMSSTEEWKQQLSKAKCGILVVVQNKTRMHMERIAHNVNTGIWRKEPPQFIGPESIAEFGTESTGLLGTKTDGYVTYKYLEGEKKDSLIRSYNFVKFTWNGSMMGTPQLAEEKVEGNGNYYFNVTRTSPSKNVVVWLITEKLMDASYQQQLYMQTQISGFNAIPRNTSPVVQQLTQPQFHAPPAETDDKRLDREILAKLTAKAEEGLPETLDNRTGLNVYYHMALQFWEQGMQAKKAGDTERAYILFLKFTTMLLERIPTHLSYQNARHDNDKAACRAKCPRVMQDMEAMQAEIIAVKKREMAMNPVTHIVLPDVPTGQRVVPTGQPGNVTAAPPQNTLPNNRTLEYTS
eukprot:TRINITY_DN2324_c0_g2_i1.p1 TRINITY_DN2324_c0_g2~~TRINITY_DN2324_c0_g2_i1.p1  ORF type:complete len:370 (-),score=75.06 TRINITY_DN2324_c0_g2_i1:35-1144(-)